MATALQQPDSASSPPSSAAKEPEAESPVRGWDWATLLPFLMAGGLLVVLAWPVLTFWAYEYTKPESYYAHAPIIPLLVGLMLWHRREALRAAPRTPALGAMAALIPALVLLVFAIKVKAEALESTGLLLTITSGVWLTLGTRWTRMAAFPLGFLWLMAPLPGPLLNDSTLHMQMASTVFADKLLHLMTFNTTLALPDIHMENYTLFVDVPCSGFKLLLSLLTFSAAFAYLVDGAPWKRFALFLFSLPLSLVVNAVRIALIGVVGECVGPDAAHVFHDWSGMITLVLGFSALFGLAKGLGCRTFAGWRIF